MNIVAYTTSKGEKRYMVRYRTPEGRQTMKRGFRRKHDATVWGEEMEAAKRRGAFTPVAAGRTTVADLTTNWLTARKAVVRPKTFHQDDSVARTYVLPRWGSVQVSQVKPAAVQEWVSALSERGLSASTVRQAHGALSKVLATAVRDHMIVSNPATGTSLPKMKQRPRVYLDPSQLARLAAACTPWSDHILTLGWTGLRIGEMSGLNVEDADTTTHRLRVVRTVSDVGGTLIEGEPKTSKGRRAVAYPLFLADIIEERANGRPGDEPLFVGARGGRLRGSYLQDHALTPAWETVGGAVRALQERLGVPVTEVVDKATVKAVEALTGRTLSEGDPVATPAVWNLLGARDGDPLADAPLWAGDRDFKRPTVHDLRHTAASLAISAGANVKAVQNMLGHASAAMTLDTYADLFPDDLDAVAGALDRLGAAATKRNVLKMCSKATEAR
ncbi:tyrosine-type recombinase/integrase [Actinomyces faecalis]|uniref:tyrosine-type recombinase/integrase n=1 Tax=Actinomyces faecalis TaxID=2722820 RepID=UPI001551CE71|nr:tyrosine-type recombinase/integrase [Actinomyces faecalis]